MSDLARRYARALYESNEVPVEEAVFRRLCGEIMDCEPLWSLLRDPVIPAEQKTAVLEALPLFSDQPLLRRFFRVLAEKRRLRLLPEVLGAYYGLMINEQNIIHCRLVSARPLGEAQLARLRGFLCAEYNKSDVFFETVIDESLVAGFILHTMGKTYDQSVRGRFLGLARHLSEVTTL